ncbi:MAG: LOG family protein [Alphaproteobacteria bacterium]|nr:LOG family protein [Alphaproteobacteria bacterium]
MRNDTPFKPKKAYLDEEFLASPDARPIRIVAEYLEPKERFDRLRVRDTILFFGSARIPSRAEAEERLAAATGAPGHRAAATRMLEMSRYYEDTRELARRLTTWSKGLKGSGRRFVVCSGGGPGIMEAANRGASEAKGENVGLCISLPFEAQGNPYITRKLAFEFHYFFMRKYWFLYLAKAMVIMPGGFGTLDELFEALTLIQTHKMTKKLPIVLFGTSYWDKVVNFEAMAHWGMIDAADVALVHRTDSVDEAYDFITTELVAHHLASPGPAL